MAAARDGVDLDRVTRRVVAGGFSYAGQSCISVQRIYVHQEVAEAFVARLVPAVDALRVGDHLKERLGVAHQAAAAVAGA